LLNQLGQRKFDIHKRVVFGEQYRNFVPTAPASFSDGENAETDRTKVKEALKHIKNMNKFSEISDIVPLDSEMLKDDKFREALKSENDNIVKRLQHYYRHN
jgi:hypothetical protein